jgi:biopolymer transport protein ExbB/TolQ
MTIRQQVHSFTDTALYAFSASDLVSQGIVLLLLLLSTYAWTIMAEKVISLARVRSSCRKFLDEFEPADSVLELALRERDFGGPLAEAYYAALNEIMNMLGVMPHEVDLYCRRLLLPRLLSDGEVEKVKSVIERVLARQNLQIEERLGALGTIVTLAPFLGLLGTVWGVMIAFVGMAQQGRADLATLAPGVSGALLTTVVGLVVAIPSVVGLNGILNSVKRTNVEMDNFIEDFVAKMRLQKTGNLGASSLTVAAPQAGAGGTQ